MEKEKVGKSVDKGVDMGVFMVWSQQEAVCSVNSTVLKGGRRRIRTTGDCGREGRWEARSVGVVMVGGRREGERLERGGEERL